MSKQWRSPGIVLIDSSAFATPFVTDDDHIVDRCAWLAYEVLKWLPGADVLFVFPPDVALSLWSRGIQGRLAYIGVRPTTKPAIVADGLRTRIMWHVFADAEGRSGRYEFGIHADRVRKFPIPLGEVVPWETIANAVIEHAAIMAIPSRTGDKPRDFDSYGIPEDEEPF